MKTNLFKPIKCASKNFTTNPFYLIQYFESAKRYVVYFRDKDKIKQFFSLFINQTVDDLQIKIYDVEDTQHPLEYEGIVTKVKLKEILIQYEEVIFHNGFHDLMIRHPATGDYIVFDEHGIIFIYTQDDYESILEEFGLDYKQNEKLIEEFDHWHYKSADENQNLKSFINALELK